MAQARNNPAKTQNSGISFKYLFPLIIIIILFVINLILIVGVVYFSYSRAVDQFIEEKTSLLRLTSGLFYGQNADHAGFSLSGSVRQDIINQAAQTPGVAFLRLVELSRGEIILSSRQDEQPGQLIGQLPQFSPEPAYRQRVWRNLPVREISLLGNNNEGLWLGLDLNTIQQPIVLMTAQSTFLIIFLVALVFILLYNILLKIFIMPFDEILNNIHQLGKGKLDIKISPRRTMIKEISQLSQALNRMKADFKKSRDRDTMISRLKSEFISIAAHQLRTPLSAVKWTMKMLLDEDLGRLGPEQKEFLQRGYSTNERMIQLVRDLLNVARIEEGRFGYNFTYVDIIKIIDDMIKELQQTAAKKNIKIKFSQTVKQYPKVKIDEQKIKLALNNLLSNAIKYSHSGGTITVSIRPYRGNYLEIAVKDGGIGIPRDQQDRLFTKFFRGRNALRKQTEGSGLGLFIVKNIIANHSGSIRAESEENQGAVFYFTLPLEARLLPKKEVQFEEFIKGF